VAETLERMFRAIRLLEKGDDARILPSGSPTLAGRLVLATGRIPRGRAQAPAEMLPGERPSGRDLAARLDALRREAAELSGRRAALVRTPGRIPHFALGALRADQWLRFARIHTAHHLAIVGNIP
jgi:hypothetical protein